LELKLCGNRYTTTISLGGAKAILEKNKIRWRYHDAEASTFCSAAEKKKEQVVTSRPS